MIHSSIVAFSRKRLNLSVVLLALVTVASCNQKSKSKSSTPPANTPPTTTTDGGLNPNGNAPGGTNTPGGPSSTLIPLVTIDIVGRPQGQASFDVEKNQIVRMKLSVGGLTATSNIGIAMTEMPTGTILTDLATVSPTITWVAATEGTYPFTVLVRDIDVCTKAGRADCAFNPAQMGNIQVNPDYDLTKTFTVTVKPRGTVGSDSIGSGDGSDIGSVIGGASNGSNVIGDANATSENQGFFSRMITSIKSAFSKAGSYLWNFGSSIWGFFTGLFS